MTLQVETGEHIRFGAFDIDFKEIDSGQPSFVDQRREAFDLLLIAWSFWRRRCGRFGVGCDGAGKAMHALDDVEIDSASSRPAERRQRRRDNRRRSLPASCGSTTRPRQPFR